MAKYVDIDTVKFQLFEMQNLEEHLGSGKYEDYDVGAITLLLESVKTFADKTLYPCFKEMDTNPAHFENGKVWVHEVVEEMFKVGGDLGLIGSCFSYEDGGVQLPHLAYIAAYYIMDAANNHVPGYLDLTTGSAHLIESFGSQELKDIYLPKMTSGAWAGTMCLTEAQAGSSLSDVETTAKRMDDGSFKLTGQKIFISGGEHDKTENIVHLVLARIEGAPAGTKGISLLVCPKYRWEDGELAPNDVSCVGDFPKMGQRGWCTTHLVFGDQNDCRAWLVGEENEGLKNMFLMMNEARITVGRLGAGMTTAAYYAALEYAQERPQGRRISKDGRKDATKEQIPIIQHADVRRMLLLQKSVAEGALSLIMQTSKYYENVIAAETPEEKQKWQLLIEILTPIVKTYPAEMGYIATNQGVQVLGGYGFCSEYILQQYLRDMRILSLYEGTTGIQSIDLLGRKVTMNNGMAMQVLMGEMQSSIEEALNYEDLKPYAQMLAQKLEVTQEVLEQLIPFALAGEYERFLSDATIFMEFSSKIVVAWQWLKMASKSQEMLITQKGAYSEGFYESKIHTMKYYFKYELNRVDGIANILKARETPTIKDAEVEKVLV